MAILAHIGPATTGLETAATAIGAGIVTGAFIVAGVRRITGGDVIDWADAARGDGFWEGAWGMFCLSIDLGIRYFV